MARIALAKSHSELSARLPLQLPLSVILPERSEWRNLFPRRRNRFFAERCLNSGESELYLNMKSIRIIAAAFSAALVCLSCTSEVGLLVDTLSGTVEGVQIEEGVKAYLGVTKSTLATVRQAFALS